jgi:sugar phosphate isomerase/epimerase
MHITFSTATFYHRGLGYSLALAREAGYDGVELALGPEFRFTGAEGLRQIALHYPVPILSMHQPFIPLPGWPRYSNQSIPYLAQVARSLGIQTIVVHVASFSSPCGPRAARFISGLKDALKMAGGDTLRIGLENNQVAKHSTPYFLDDLRVLADFALEHGCGVTFDTCHAAANGQDILECYDIVRPALYNVHLNDMVYRVGKHRTHIPPGKGQLPLDRFLGLLARDQYDGLVTLEMHPSRLGLVGHGRHLKTLQESLHFVRSAIAQPIAS